MDFFRLKLILIEFRVKKVLFGPFIDSESEGTRCELVTEPTQRPSGKGGRIDGSCERSKSIGSDVHLLEEG